MTPTPTAPAATALSAEQLRQSVLETVMYVRRHTPNHSAKVLVDAIMRTVSAALAPQPAGGVGDGEFKPKSIRPYADPENRYFAIELYFDAFGRDDWVAAKDLLERLATPRPSRQGGEDPVQFGPEKRPENMTIYNTVAEWMDHGYSLNHRATLEAHIASLQVQRPAAPVDAATLRTSDVDQAQLIEDMKGYVRDLNRGVTSDDAPRAGLIPRCGHCGCLMPDSKNDLCGNCWMLEEEQMYADRDRE